MLAPIIPTERQRELLAKEDWRFHAIGPVGTGLGSMATTEKLDKKLYTFGLPSAPAVFLSLARNAHVKRIDLKLTDLFDDHEQGCWPDNQEKLFDFVEAYGVEVIFSFTAIEAFANEVLPDDFKYEYRKTKKSIPELLTRYEIERMISLNEKLNSVLPRAHDVKSPKGLKAWQDYKLIKHFRSRLIHLKSVDRKASGPEDQTLWGAMLENRDMVFSDMAHNIIGHYEKLVNERRWFKLYISPIKSS